MASIDIVLLMPEAEKGAIARMRLETGATIEIYKNQKESGFSGFGVQMQSLNQTGILVSFLNQARQGMMAYFDHPVFA